MLDWNRIDTLLLDMDGVLLDLAFDEFFWHFELPARYAAVYHLDEDDAREKLLAMYREREGRQDWYDVDYWSRRLGFDVASIKVRQAHRIREHAGVRFFLARARERGCRSVLLTNAHPKTLRLKMAVTRLEPLLDETISTFELGAGKESRTLWERLQRRLDLDPARTLLVEDSATNLRTARDYGIGQLVYISRPNSLRGAVPHPEFHSIEGLADLACPPLSPARSRFC
ncbi:MAG: HAD hydrolase-like protein [Nitrospirota bacterium]|nr:HAD hydrolase-like protein [Nitrospirota bacterium]